MHVPRDLLASYQVYLGWRTPRVPVIVLWSETPAHKPTLTGLRADYEPGCEPLWRPCLPETTGARLRLPAAGRNLPLFRLASAPAWRARRTLPPRFAAALARNSVTGLAGALDSARLQVALLYHHVAGTGGRVDVHIDDASGAPGVRVTRATRADLPAGASQG